MVLTRDAEVKSYKLFCSLLPGCGLDNGWIKPHNGETTEKQLFGIGNPEGWTDLFIFIKNPTDQQLQAWNEKKDTIGVQPFEGFFHDEQLWQIGFTTTQIDLSNNANQLQTLSSEVAADQPADTVQTSQEPVRTVRSRKRTAASGDGQ